MQLFFRREINLHYITFQKQTSKQTKNRHCFEHCPKWATKLYMLVSFLSKMEFNKQCCKKYVSVHSVLAIFFEH